MKKIVFVAAVLLLSFTAVPSFAETVSADDVSVYLLKRWVSEKYGCKIDDDGDLILNKDGGKIFVTVKKKQKMVRIFSIFGAYEKRSINEMIKLANRFNDKKIFLRVSINPESGSSWCDHYIVYNGGLNSKNFIETVDWFIALEKSWNDFVVNNGD